MPSPSVPSPSLASSPSVPSLSEPSPSVVSVCRRRSRRRPCRRCRSRRRRWCPWRRRRTVTVGAVGVTARHGSPAGPVVASSSLRGSSGSSILLVGLAWVGGASLLRGRPADKRYPLGPGPVHPDQPTRGLVPDLRARTRGWPPVGSSEVGGPHWGDRLPACGCCRYPPGRGSLDLRGVATPTKSRLCPRSPASAPATRSPRGPVRWQATKRGPPGTLVPRPSAQRPPPAGSVPPGRACTVGRRTRPRAGWR